MSSILHTQVRELLASYVDAEPSEFQMEVSLDVAYDMDSTELTEVAKKIEQRFGVRATHSQRQDWNTGEDICRFLEGRLAQAATA
jgi:acyl carrier protein